MRLLICLVMVALLSTGTQLIAQKEAKVRFESLPSATDTAFKTVNGVKLRPVKGGLMDLSHYKGKVLIVNFFATWCPPCLKELPEFVEMQGKYGKKGVQFIGVAVDGTPAEIATFGKKKGLNFPLVMTNNDLRPVFGDIQGIPTTFVVDRELRIVDKWVGYLRADAVEARLRKWL